MDDNVLTLDNEYQEDVDLEGEVFAVGERGYSAYEIALQNGFIGTEEEWLESLKGDKGDPGEGVPEGGTAGQILSKVDGTDYNTEWIDVPDIDGKTNYLGELSDFDRPSKALNADDLDEDKIYVIMNDIDSTLYSKLVCKITTQSYGVLVCNLNNLGLSRENTQCLYVRKHITTSGTRTNYLEIFGQAISYSPFPRTRYYKWTVYEENGALQADMVSTTLQLVTVNTTQDISGRKTFTTLPESSVVPTAGDQLVNKKYVDDNGGQTIQYDTMPTASEDTVGQVVQYIGETDTDYTNGYFYIGATDGEDPATYSWEQLNVQPGSSGGDDEVYFIENINANNPFIFEGKKKGIYILKYPMKNFPYKINEDSNRFMLPNTQQILRIDLYKDMDKTTQTTNGVCKIYYYTINLANYSLVDYCETNYDVAYTNTSYVVLSGSSTTNYGKYVNALPQTFDGVKTFTSIPEQSNTNAPTLDTQFTNKAYVDSKAIQYSTMPTASSSTVGKIVQYIGTTDTNYTNGYFYVGTTDGADPATYGWENINVQPSGGSSGSVCLGNLSDYSSSSTPLRVDQLDEDIVYVIFNDLTSTGNIYLGYELDGVVKTASTSIRQNAYCSCVFVQRKEYDSSTNHYKGYLWYEGWYPPAYSISRALYRLAVINNNLELNVETSNTYNCVTIDHQHTISAKHTFSVLPEASGTPTTINQLTNKKYVDNKVGKVTAMSTPTSSLVGQVVQYIGVTDSDYTHGYFYECVSITEGGLTTYEWQQLDVQPSSGGGGDESIPMYTLDSSTTIQSGKTNLNATDLAELSTMFTDAYSKNRESINILMNATNNISRKHQMLLTVFNSYDGQAGSPSILTKPTRYGLAYFGNGSGIVTYPSSASEYYVVFGWLNMELSWTDDVCTVSFAQINMTPTVMPSTNGVLTRWNSTAYTPTANYHPATKKYVDDNVSPVVTTSSTASYTIASLTGNNVYKLGEITALTITAVTTFDRESVIYFDSGSTPTTISIPNTLTNLGDVPTLTTSGGVNTGTCSEDKSYIIAIENNIAIWKEY